MIKKFAYDFARTSQDKSNFLQTLINLILTPHIDYVAKDFLSSALEYIFIEDQGKDSYIQR